MPASKDYTLIKLMRGSTASSDMWIPEAGEPLLDLETGTLRFGDASSLGGIPINTVTTTPLKSPTNLNEEKTWGRYYINGAISNAPPEVGSSGKFILLVQSSALKSAEIIQTLYSLDTSKPARTYSRITINAGVSWTPWKDDANGFDTPPGGGGGDPSSYTDPGNYYLEPVINGPSGTASCGAFLFTYRKNKSSPYIYQFLLLTKCTTHDGKIFVRHSRDGGSTWTSSIYNGWYELTDFCKQDFSNATGILKPANGGTGRSDGTVKQSDESKYALYSGTT